MADPRFSIATIENELERQDRVVIAAEDWSKQYNQDPTSHAKLIKGEAKLARLLRGYFRDLSKRAPNYVNWPNYSLVKADIKIDLILNDAAFDGESDILMQILHDPLLSTIAAGAMGGELIYNRPLGLSDTSASIQKLARDQVARLVGKRLDKNGHIVDNPNSSYSITDVTRDRIIESIKTSLGLGETVEDATSRIERLVNDPYRAGVIAATESVNGYQSGLAQMATQSGAVGKEWQDVGADDVCADNSAEGIIDINDSFGSGDSQPAAHPNCRCGLRYVYPEELS